MAASTRKRERVSNNDKKPVSTAIITDDQKESASKNGFHNHETSQVFFRFGALYCVLQCQ